MGEPADSMALLRTSGNGMGNFYAGHHGGAAIILWDHGFGIVEQDGDLIHDGVYDEFEHWLAPNQLSWLVAIANGYA